MKIYLEDWGQVTTIFEGKVKNTPSIVSMLHLSPVEVNKSGIDSTTLPLVDFSNTEEGPI